MLSAVVDVAVVVLCSIALFVLIFIVSLKGQEILVQGVEIIYIPVK